MAAKKTIENKETTLNFKEGEETRKMTYFDIIKLCLDSPPQGGFSRDDIKKRNRIEDKLKGEIGSTVELEHDEFYSLKKICNDMKWNTRVEDIENFLDYLDDVK